MEDRKQGKNNKSKWDAVAFRRKCIRIIAFIYVFFMVLNQRLSVKVKKRLALSFCSCVVAVVIIFSIVGQRGLEITRQEVTADRFMSENDNRIMVGQTGASIEMKRSRVLKEQTEELSPVQALLENNGENNQSETKATRFQFPVELGYEDEQNYDGVQSEADYIKKEIYYIGDEEIEEKPIKEEEGERIETSQIESVSSAAISQAQESGAAVSAASQAEAGDNDIKDTVAPVLTFDEEQYFKIQGKDKTIFCSNDNNIKVNASDDADGTVGSGVEKICYVYGEELRYCIAPTWNTGIEISDNFYGKIAANCLDAAGNKSDILSKYVLIENQAPQIEFSQDTLCTAPYRFWVNIGETGHIVSGIRDVTCQVNGKPYQITDLTTLESTSLDEGVEVPTQCEFSIPFTEEGNYSVVVTVTDNAGNITTERRIIQVTKPELISVFMPEKFAIHIDPQRLTGREQIYSDDITLKNESNFDVQVTVKNVEVSVQDEVSASGIKKDCNIYMIAPDTGKKIPLKKGENKEVYSYHIKKEDEIGIIRFVGDTTEGSDAMWKDSDVVLRVDLEFKKKE